MNKQYTDGHTFIHDGYIMEKSKDHPNAINHFVRQHRLVMEKEIGRYLETNELVHHINGIKSDNRIENLKILTISEHISLHNLQDKEYKNKYNNEEVIKLYNDGLTMREISKQLNIPKSTVAVYVFKANISRNNISTRGYMGRFVKGELV